MIRVSGAGVASQVLMAPRMLPDDDLRLEQRHQLVDVDRGLAEVQEALDGDARA